MLWFSIIKTTEGVSHAESDIPAIPVCIYLLISLIYNAHFPKCIAFPWGDM